MAQQLAVEAAVLQATKILEAHIDNELQQLDQLQQGDADIEKLRQERLHALRRRQELTKTYIEKGHGEYSQLHDEKAFFQAIKGEERVVCHFFRDSWPCKVMDKHLAVLAKRHLPTKFVKIDAEKSPYLTEKLKIWMLPTLALVRTGKIVDYVVGFDAVGGRDDFSTEALEQHLYRLDVLEESAMSQPPAVAKQRSVRGSIYKKSGSDEDSDFD